MNFFDPLKSTVAALAMPFRYMFIAWIQSPSRRTSLALGFVPVVCWPSCNLVQFAILCDLWSQWLVQFRFNSAFVQHLRLYGSFDEITREWSDGVAAEDTGSPQGFGIVWHKMITGWWFGTFFLTFHILGRIIPTDFHIFQRGRFKPPTRFKYGYIKFFCDAANAGMPHAGDQKCHKGCCSTRSSLGVELIFARRVEGKFSGSVLTFVAFKVMFDGPVDALWIEWLCCKWRWCCRIQDHHHGHLAKEHEHGPWRQQKVVSCQWRDHCRTLSFPSQLGEKCSVSSIIKKFVEAYRNDSKQRVESSGKYWKHPSFRLIFSDSFGFFPIVSCFKALTAQMRMMFEVEAAEIMRIAIDSIDSIIDDNSIL